MTGAWIGDGVLAAQTLDKFGLLIRRFARYAAAHDVSTLADVDPGLVAKFVAIKAAPDGIVSQAAVAIMHNRRRRAARVHRPRRLQLTSMTPPPTSTSPPAHRQRSDPCR